jgi:NAD(P)-dependent dehydrogenase (short-subunit alcohol dehydrogenase family)
MDELRFDERVAIVTGGGRGMGRSHALLLAQRGASVVVNDVGTSTRGEGRSEGPANDVVAEIEAAGGTAMADYADVTSYEEVERMMAATIERFGRLDILISNAGISDAHVPFLDVTPERYDRLVRVHQYGTFNITRCAWPALVESGSGRIVVTTSNAIFGVPEDVHYAGAKGAIVTMAKSLAFDGEAHGIKVNVVAPGGFTRVVDASMADGPAKEVVKQVAPAQKASWIYACLAHESCAVTGEVFGTVGGMVTRIFFGQTRGYLASNAEDLHAHLDDVMAEDGYWVPEGSRADGAHWMSTLNTAAADH